jgi:hypothetical protein
VGKITAISWPHPFSEFVGIGTGCIEEQGFYLNTTPRQRLG